MKKTFYYLPISTTALLFLGCTPPQMPKPTTPSKVIHNNTNNPSISTSSSITLGQPITSETPINKVPAPIGGLSRTIVIEPTESSKIPEELIPTDIEEDTIQETQEYISNRDLSQSSKIPPEELNSKAPENYRNTIRQYLSKDVKYGESVKYVFSRPQKVSKKDLSWKGWMVEVDMLKRNGEGNIVKNRPYIILFDGNTIGTELSSAETLKKIEN